MVYSEDASWLDSLVKHAIFELNDEERKRVESITANQTRSSSSQQHITDFVLQHHNRVIALRENDLFVAVGCQIRVLSLTELKDAWVYASKKANESKTELSENWIRFVPYKVKIYCVCVFVCVCAQLLAAVKINKQNTLYSCWKHLKSTLILKP